MKVKLTSGQKRFYEGAKGIPLFGPLVFDPALRWLWNNYKKDMARKAERAQEAAKPNYELLDLVDGLRHRLSRLESDQAIALGHVGKSIEGLQRRNAELAASSVQVDVLRSHAIEGLQRAILNVDSVKSALGQRLGALEATQQRDAEALGLLAASVSGLHLQAVGAARTASAHAASVQKGLAEVVVRMAVIDDEVRPALAIHGAAVEELNRVHALSAQAIAGLALSTAECRQAIAASSDRPDALSEDGPGAPSPGIAAASAFDILNDVRHGQLRAGKIVRVRYGASPAPYDPARFIVGDRRDNGVDACGPLASLPTLLADVDIDELTIEHGIEYLPTTALLEQLLPRCIARLRHGARLTLVFDDGDVFLANVRNGIVDIEEFNFMIQASAATGQPRSLVSGSRVAAALTAQGMSNVSHRPRSPHHPRDVQVTISCVKDRP